MGLTGDGIEQQIQSAWSRVNKAGHVITPIYMLPSGRLVSVSDRPASINLVGWFRAGIEFPAFRDAVYATWRGMVPK